MIHNLGENNSLFNQYISEIRDQVVQIDSMRFRRNLERLSEIMAYEISKKLDFQTTEIPTPLGIAHVSVLKQYPVISSILRAGLPMHQGFLNYFDKSKNIFISAHREYDKDGGFTIKFSNVTGTSIEGETVILADPMLATGASMVLAYKALLEKGKPKHTHIVSLIASKEGVEYLVHHLGTHNITLWVGAIDDELTIKSYIVPGLGDAGDLAFGEKE